MRFAVHFVIPAQAGILYFEALLDPGLRRGDGFRVVIDTL